jgi:two-component system, NarL family, nitrate/nitrite response regulator NarL
VTETSAITTLSPLPPSPASRERGVRVVVAVAAGYPAVRAGLVALLRQAKDIDASEAMPGLLETTATAPDVIVIDAGSTDDGAIEALSDAYPASPLVFVGGDPATDGPGLSAGAVAYLPPDADAATLAAAVRGVALGLTVVDPALIVAAGVHFHSRSTIETGPSGETLTAREREVLALVAAGLPNKTIARELGISEHTAKFHVGSLLAKLGAASRTEAVTIATRRGLLAI